MTVTSKRPAYDTSADVARLLDAGYEVSFQRWGEGEVFASITTETGSRWKGLGSTPGEAVRSVWPLGYGPGQGGCGHCNGMGCERPGCATCAAYGPSVAGDCGVCGYADPAADGDDEDQDDDGVPALAVMVAAVADEMYAAGTDATVALWRALWNEGRAYGEMDAAGRAQWREDMARMRERIEEFAAAGSNGTAAGAR